MAMAAQDQACRFFPATTLVQLLQKAKAAYDLPAMLQKLDRYVLLVIDDISYVRRIKLETSVLFELICHRYECKSLLVTSNQPFREWDDIFPRGSMTVAAVDRLVQHCHIIGIKGESYRQKAAAARVSRNPGDTTTELTQAPWPPRSTAPPLQPRERCRRHEKGPTGRVNLPPQPTGLARRDRHGPDPVPTYISGRL